MKKTEKTMKTQPRKLVLASETIRKLTVDQLLMVNAGLPRVNDSTVWGADGCN